MEKREHHFLGAVGESGKTRRFFELIMKFRLGVRPEETAENALDFDS